DRGATLRRSRRVSFAVPIRRLDEVSPRVRGDESLECATERGNGLTVRAEHAAQKTVRALPFDRLFRKTRRAHDHALVRAEEGLAREVAPAIVGVADARGSGHLSHDRLSLLVEERHADRIAGLIV